MGTHGAPVWVTMRSKTILLLLVSLAGSALGVACSGSESTDLTQGVGNDDDEELSKLQACGGIAGLKCSSGKVCVDDPRDSCNPGKGGRDCMGVCVDPSKTARCGGIAGLVCKTGQVCVDDPKDSCNPSAGGRDCMGYCVKVQTGSGPHCPTIRCASGFHCEEKGINGGSIGVCIHD